MHWYLKHPQATMEMLGYIPEFLDENDPRPAKEQINANYQHGGGWHSISGYKIIGNGLKYPGDPPRVLIAETKLRDETIQFFNGARIAIVQPDGSYEVAIID